MINVLLGCIALFWSYKLFKIIQNSYTLRKYARELEEMVQKKPVDATTAKRYKVTADKYRTANIVQTRSKLLWMLFEIGSVIAIYYIFIKKTVLW